jgi:ATP-dependent helicase/nuclease subunit A
VCPSNLSGGPLGPPIPPGAARWEDVVLGGGKLTVVGDAKQSIYRFRRADVAMYDRVLRVIAKTPLLEVRLSANFRSVPPLIDWFNDRFARILKESQDAFDPVTGRVFHQPLAPGRDAQVPPSVHVLNLAFSDAGKHNVDDYRSLEGRALARYLRWLIETDDVQILDPLDELPRKVRYGDIAVLATSTWSLPHLFQPLDEEGIPYASRGGVLFLKDSLHRQFLLGLRAIADRDDGVAMAALLRPPFFAVDPADLLREQVATRAGEAPVGESALRAREARDLLVDLRRHRFDRPPGATARDLLERTAFARNVASGPNGTQRLARLRELCLILEQLAADEGLDYDAATSRLREWVDEPVQLDPPHPVGAEAVQVLSVHQAKGLEFPVVVIWDGQGRWAPPVGNAPWRMERDGRGWMMDLAGLTWEEPAGLGIRKTELDYQRAERERVAYVAATRARDLLIVPKAGELKPGRFVCSDLLAEAPTHLVKELEPYVDGHEPAWATQNKPPIVQVPKDGASIEQATDAWWTPASAESARPRFRPASVSGETQSTPVDDTQEEADPALAKPREGRFGPVFGTSVHHAIGLILRDSALTPEEAARRAAQRFGLQDYLAECIADITRALESLRTEGLARPLGPDLQVEYPVAAAWDDGQLLGGYIDLVSATDGCLDVLDFKTDTPPSGPVEQAYPAYAGQVRTYGRLLEKPGTLEAPKLRCGLLFTADGGIRWVR